MELSGHGKQINISDALCGPTEESIPTVVTTYCNNLADDHPNSTCDCTGIKCDVYVHFGSSVVKSNTLSEDAYAEFNIAPKIILDRLSCDKLRLRGHYCCHEQKLSSSKAQQFVLGHKLATEEEQPLIVGEIENQIKQPSTSEAFISIDLTDLPLLLSNNSAKTPSRSSKCAATKIQLD